MEHEFEGPDLLERRAPRRSVEPSLRDTADGARAALANHDRPALTRTSVLSLQRSVGNSATTTLIQRATDLEEREAGPDGRRSSVLDVVGKGEGDPLPGALRSDMESSLGADFSDVRVHSGDRAAQSASEVSAKAYTAGNEIVLGKSAAPLDTPAGRKTLAHELTHVVQQRNGPVDGTSTGGGISVSDPGDRFEQAAVANAERVAGAGSSSSTAGGVPTQRHVDEDHHYSVQTEDIGENESDEFEIEDVDSALQTEGEDEFEGDELDEEDL